MKNYNMKQEEKNKATIEKLKKELKRYKKGYEILICYFDSISDCERINNFIKSFE